MLTLELLLMSELTQSDIIELQKFENRIAINANPIFLPDKQDIIDRTRSNIEYLTSKRYNLKCKR